MKKGEITVYLSLLFVLLISFVMGVLEAAIVQTEKNMCRLKADRAVFSVFGEYIKSLKLKDMVIASPDVGGSKRANSYAKYFGVPLVLCHKSRAKANEVESMTVIGDVKDKNVILVDDMVDTAGTITKAADLMISKGALSVRAIASHAVMSDPASSRVTESKMTEMIFTDSIPYYKDCPKVHIISIADMFADTIRRVYENESISSQYII